MKIKKYKKDKSNKYKVLIDDEEIVLYDDIIIKYNLLMKSEIDVSTYNEMIKENSLLLGYYEAIKYITKKMRSKKEIEEYLVKKGLNSKEIKETIKKLEDNKFINEDIYLKAYINDQINLTNNGVNKIKKNLLKLGLDNNKIDDYLSKIDEYIFLDKIDKYIEKKIKFNKNTSSYMLKNKIIIDLVNLGFNKEDIISELNKFEIDDKEAYNHEYEKIKKSLEKKYSGDELKFKIREKLYKKGFRYNEI